MRSPHAAEPPAWLLNQWIARSSDFSATGGSSEGASTHRSACVAANPVLPLTSPQNTVDSDSEPAIASPASSSGSEDLDAPASAPTWRRTPPGTPNANAAHKPLSGNSTPRSIAQAASAVAASSPASTCSGAGSGRRSNRSSTSRNKKSAGTPVAASAGGLYARPFVASDGYDVLGFPVAPPRGAADGDDSGGFLGALLTRLVSPSRAEEPASSPHVAAWHSALGLPPPAAPSDAPTNAPTDAPAGSPSIAGCGPSHSTEPLPPLRLPLDLRRLKPLVLGPRGIPHALRGRVWFALLETSLGDPALGEHPGLRAAMRDPSYFPALLRRRGRATHAAVRRLIRTDARRTFGDHRHARRLQGAIARVLDAYSHRNPALGYCQSMNFLAGLLLLLLPEETAFLALCVLIERVLPSGLHAPQLQGLTAELRLLGDVLSRSKGAVLAHLQRHGVLHDACASRWLMTCFVSVGLPWRHALRLWDAMLFDAACKGALATSAAPRRAPSSVPLACCAALLAQAAPRLLAAPDAEALVTALLAMPGELTATQLEAMLAEVTKFVGANLGAGGADRIAGLAIAPLREQHRRVVEAETLLRDDRGGAAGGAVADEHAPGAQLQSERPLLLNSPRPIS